jgi:hypothetical protein
MSTNDPLYRQLRFAFLLQIAGAVMFGVAFATRAVALGFDPVTALLGLVMLLVIAAAVFTRRKMQDLSGL